MARKSPWQQFADNFESTYGTFNKMFQGLETGRIMREEPEVVRTGLKNPHQDYLATYGGKEYSEQITPDMLTGLRNQRLTNVMTKYGDIKGGMELQLRQEELEQKKRANVLGEETLAFEIESKKLGVDQQAQTLEYGEVQLKQARAEHQSYLDTLDATERLAYAKALGAELTTDGQILSLEIGNATKADVIKASALGVRAQELANKHADLANIGLEINNRGELVRIRVAEATEDVQIGLAEKKLTAQEISNAQGILQNIGLRITNEGDLLTLEMSKALHEKEIIIKAKQQEITLQELAQKEAYNDVYAEYAKKAKAGEFKTQEDANNFLLQGLNKLNPELAMDLQQNYNKHEIQNITDQGVILKDRAMLALAEGGLDGLRQSIDDTNGINGVEIIKKDGVITLNEVNRNGKKVRQIATGKGMTEFTANLKMSLDPATMMETAKSYMDLNKSEAEAMYQESLSKWYDQKTKGLQQGDAPSTKAEWAIARLLKTPNDPIGLAALLGENMSHTEIAALVTDAGVVQVVDDEQNRINNTDTSDTADTADTAAESDGGRNLSADLGLGGNKRMKELVDLIAAMENKRLMPKQVTDLANYKKELEELRSAKK